MAATGARDFDAEAYDGGIVGLKLTDEPNEVETETPASPVKTAPAKKTGGRRQAKAA